jgi:hypothetical protein
MRTVNEWTVDAVSALLLTLSLSISVTFLLTLTTYRVDAQTSAPVAVVDTLVTNAAKEKT